MNKTFGQFGVAVGSQAARVARLLVLGLGVTAIASCGGGSGAEGEPALAANEIRTGVKAPDLQYKIDSAVLNADIKLVEAGLVGPDAEGNFVAADISAFQVGKIFVFEKAAFKIKGIEPLIGGTTGRLFATPASIDETYSDLKFSYTIHPVSYDDNGRVQAIQQPGIFSELKRTLGRGIAKKNASVAACIIPKADLSIGADEFGSKYEIDCTLAQLLALPDSSGLDFVHIKGTLDNLGKTEVYKDLKVGTEFIDSSVNYNLKATAGIQTGGKFPFGKLKAGLESLCSQYHLTTKNLRCEVEDDHGELKATIAVGLTKSNFLTPTPVPLPVYVSTGLLLEIGFKLSGEVTVGGVFSNRTLVGRIAGKKIEFNPSPSITFSTPIFMATGELDVFSGVYVAAGIGGGETVSGLEARIDLGAYIKGMVSGPPICARTESGGRVKLEVTALRIGEFEGFRLADLTYDFPFLGWAVSAPKDCDGPPGTIALKYVLNGRDFYKFDYENSTPTLDSYLVNYKLIEPTTLGSTGRISFDLTTTRAIAGRPIAFEVEVAGNSKMVSLRPSESTLDKPSSGGTYRAVIDVSSTSYGDSIKLRLKAYVPGDRSATEIVRDVVVRVESQLAASPVFYENVDTAGSETFQMRLNFGSAAVAELVQGGYIEFADGDNWPIERDGTGWKTSFSKWLNCSVCSRVKPMRLVLFSDKSRTGAGQTFAFIEETAPSIEKIVIDPSFILVGDTLTARVSGRLLPAGLQMDIPNCDSVEEKRSSENIRYRNWASDYRIFTCKATTPGLDLVARAVGVESGFGLYSILIESCARGEYLVLGVCVPGSGAPVLSFEALTTPLSINSPITGSIRVTDPGDQVKYLRIHVGRALNGSDCQIDIGDYNTLQDPGVKTFSGCASMTATPGSLYLKLEARDSKGLAAVDVQSVVTVAGTATSPSLAIDLTPSAIEALRGNGVGAFAYETAAASGRGRPAAKFTAGYLRVPNSPEMQFRDGATFDLWARIDGGSATYMTLLAKSHDRTGVGFLALKPTETRGVGFGYVHTATFDPTWEFGTGCQYYPEVANVAVGSWFRMTIAISSTTGWRHYVNKRLVHSCPNARLDFATMNTQDLFIGRFSDNFYYPLDGAISDIRIYQKALTEAEVGLLP